MPDVIFTLDLELKDSDVCDELCKHFLEHLEEGARRAEVDELESSADREEALLSSAGSATS